MSFDNNAILTAIDCLRNKGHNFTSGMTDTELAMIESRYGFTFPPDLRFFLQSALPDSTYFVNWRASQSELDFWFSRQVDGILFDVQNNVFWHAGWDLRPASVAEALRIAERELERVPKLIPIGDRLFAKCIPASPCIAGNPVFSVNQADVLHAGRDLADYLGWLSRPSESFEQDEEEGTPPTPVFSKDYRQIDFWTELARRNAA